MAIEGAVVRPMRLDELDFRIDYFHDASDDYLLKLGVDRALLGSKDEWRAYYEEDFARPLAERETYNLVWELDGRIVNWADVDDVGDNDLSKLWIASRAETASVGAETETRQSELWTVIRGQWRLQVEFTPEPEPAVRVVWKAVKIDAVSDEHQWNARREFLLQK